MARSPSSASEDESDTDNRKHIKSEKARGKQPVRANGRAHVQSDGEEDTYQSLQQTQRIADSQDEQDEEDEGYDSGEDESPNGKKRQRLNDDGDSAVVKEEAEGLVPTPLIRNADNYVTGSVVRVLLHNFVTYDDVEFRPGPYLNMILGPNGTGKSSIACALCIGLGFPPSIMGRSTDLSAFVKHGHDTGFVEIELKGFPEEENVTVRRNLSNRSKGSTYLLNGQASRQSAVNKEMVRLNVHVDNLCCFLPQDKVAEFARMSPQQLLRETEKAAGHPELNSWHDTLTKAGKELKVMVAEIDAQKKDLNLARLRNEALKTEVDAFRERQEQERMIGWLELAYKYYAFAEARKRYLDEKSIVSAQKQRVLALEARNKPMHDFLSTLKDKQKHISKEREKAKKNINGILVKLKQKHSKSDELEQETEESQTKLSLLQKNEKARKNNITKLRDEIARTQHLLENPQETEDPEPIKDEKSKLRTEVAKLQSVQLGVHARQQANVEAGAKTGAEITRAQQELKNLEDVSQRKMNELQKWDPNCAAAIVWLRQNQHRFKQEVFEPAILSVTIPNRAYAASVENCFNANQLKTFVTQCDEDYRLLNQLVNDSTEALGRKARINVWFRPRVVERLPPPPLNPAELRDIGFDGYAIDYVDCRDGFKWYLQREIMLHRTAVALGPNVDVDRMSAAVVRDDGSGQGGQGANYIAGGHVFRVTRSFYGQRLPQTASYPLRPARNFAMARVEPSAISSLNQIISEQREIEKSLEQESKTLSDKEQEVRAQFEELKSEQKALDARLEAIKKVQQEIERTKVTLEQMQKKLQREEGAPAAHVQIQRLQSEILQTAVKRVQVAEEYRDTLREVAGAMRQLTELGFRATQLIPNIAAMEELINEHDQEYQNAQQDFLRLEDGYKRMKAEAKEALAILNEANDAADSDISILREEEVNRNDSAEVPKTSEDYQNLLTLTQAKLEQNRATNAGVIETYEKREKVIEEMTEKLEKKEIIRKDKEEEVNKAKAGWKPALESLVKGINKKFSKAFDRTGRVGEIQLAEHEDYDKWAIEILVKFRDTEPLQLLTGQRQSGGERALTTILYLMSLTELARSPFSLVDEINQGMDQNAERDVHNQLVEVACAKDSGQYFLITPKLLPALNYHERMKILCVNNGEWLNFEEDHPNGRGNMMKMIDDTLAQRGTVRVPSPES